MEEPELSGKKANVSSEKGDRANPWIFYIGTIIWLYVSIAAFVPFQTRAEKEKVQARKCFSLQLNLSGIAEMYEMNKEGSIFAFDSELLEKLKRQKYVKEDIPKHALEFLRFREGEIFCLTHGTSASASEGLSAREQLKRRGISNPNLLMRARDETIKGWVHNYGDPNLSGFGETILWILCSFLIAMAIDKHTTPGAGILLLTLSMCIVAIFASEHLAVLKTYF